MLYATFVQIDILRGDAAAALRDAPLETDPPARPRIQPMARQIGPDHQQADAALRDYIAGNGDDQPCFVADLYALRKQPGAVFAWLQRAWRQHDPNFTGGVSVLSSRPLMDPFLLACQHDPRRAALCQQSGLPLPRQPPPATASSSGH